MNASDERNHLQAQWQNWAEQQGRHFEDNNTEKNIETQHNKMIIECPMPQVKADKETWILLWQE